MKKVILFGVIILTPVLILFELAKGNDVSYQTYPHKARQPASIDSRGVVVFAKTTQTESENKKIDISGSTPLEVANNYLKTHREKWNIRKYHKLRSAVFESPLGTKVKYAVFQGELPILGLEVGIEVGRNLIVKSVDNKYMSLEKIDLQLSNELTKEKVIENWQPTTFLPEIKSAKDISQVLVYVNGRKKPMLAYVVSARDFKHRSVQVLLRASDGQVMRTAFSRAEF